MTAVLARMVPARWLLIVLLALVPFLTAADVPSEAEVERAARSLAGKFEALRRDGLGVSTLEMAYNSISYIYSTIEDGAVEDLFMASSPQAPYDAVIRVLNNRNRVVNPSNSTPNDCCSVAGDCCYYCDADDNMLFNGFAANHGNDVDASIEFQVGLSDGSLYEFPRVSSPCSYSDPRLTTWYSRATAGATREIVIVLDLSGNNVTGLNEAALQVIASFTPDDMVGLVVIGSIRQRVCPDTLSAATDVLKYSFTEVIQDNQLPTDRDDSAAFAAARRFFTSSPSSTKVMLFLTDGSESNYGGATLPVDSSFDTLVYSRADATMNEFFTNATSVGRIADIASFWDVPDGLSESTHVSAELSSNGVVSLALTRAWIRNRMFLGVITARIPWQLLMTDLEMMLSRRPSSYYFAVNRQGRFLYHSRFPMRNIMDVEPTTVETAPEFVYMLGAIRGNQNESMPFNNTLVYSQPSFNQSHFIRTVPSVYHCQLVLNDIFVCLTLADEDRSIVDTFNVTRVSSYYSANRPSPVYQSTLSSLSEQCNYFCQYSIDDRLTLQMTTPNSPPPTADLSDINDYISGTNTTAPNWLRRGIAEEVAIHSQVTDIWTNRFLLDNMTVSRRYLATPTGVFLTYPGIQLNSSLSPVRLPWYAPAVANPGQLVLSPAQSDLLYPSLGNVFSVSQAIQSRPRLMYSDEGSVLSVVAADICVDSLRADVSQLLDGRLCNSTGIECSVISSDGFFVLTPPGVSSNNPLHLTAHEEYTGVSLSLIQSGILVKTACNDMTDPMFDHHRFYYIVSSAISMSCYNTSLGSKDFCISAIDNTNAFLLLAIDKQRSDPDAIRFCQQPECSFCNNFDRTVECPCTCEELICATLNYSFPVCPTRSTGPVNFVPNSGTLQENCDDSSISSISSCSIDRCTPSTSPATTTPPATINTLALIVGVSVGAIVFGALLIVLFTLCCIWNKYHADSEPTEKGKSELFNAVDSKPKASNKMALEMEEKS